MSLKNLPRCGVSEKPGSILSLTTKGAANYPDAGGTEAFIPGCLRSRPTRRRKRESVSGNLQLSSFAENNWSERGFFRVAVFSFYRSSALLQIRRQEKVSGTNGVVLGDLRNF